MNANWNAATGLPQADLEAIRREGGPREQVDDQNVQWYKNMARKLYPTLVHDDLRDEATFQRDYTQMEKFFTEQPDFRDFIQNKQIVCAQTDGSLRADYLRAFDMIRVHGADWVSAYQGGKVAISHAATTYVAPTTTFTTHTTTNYTPTGTTLPDPGMY